MAEVVNACCRSGVSIGNADSGPASESDAYPFGVCIIQAHTGQLPWDNVLPDGGTPGLVMRGAFSKATKLLQPC